MKDTTLTLAKTHSSFTFEMRNSILLLHFNFMSFIILNIIKYVPKI